MIVDRLKALYGLQKIDVQLDELEELKGELPAAVAKLERELVNLKNEIVEKEELIKKNEEFIVELTEQSEKKIENQIKFKAQLHAVRNNREYDALTKEIDAIETDLSKAEKITEEKKAESEKAREDIDFIKPLIEEKTALLETTNVELAEITSNTEREAKILTDNRTAILKGVKSEDYNIYTTIRKAKKGKAVVPVRRNACGGCFGVVPPQRQLELRKLDQIYRCEFCGRILIDLELANSIK